ncbi:MAG TPA: hypothetical protein VM076_15895 [Gemmatimonadaceae bacterium]|nr:hypothetical protein [Gemmatimonadaceae bacterium]
MAVAIGATAATVRAQAPNTVSCATHQVGSRTSHSLAYDASIRRVVMFGGASSDTANPQPRSLWAWDGRRWTCVSNDGPPGRADTFLGFDAARNRLVLFGGRVFEGGRRFHFVRDTWEWDGRRWTLADTAGPGPRIHGAIAYDPTRRRIVVHGGGGADDLLADTWEWMGASWRQVPVRVSAGTIGDALLPSSQGLTLLAVSEDHSPDCPSAFHGSLFQIQADSLVRISPPGPCISPIAPATAAPNGFLLYTGWNLDEPATTWLWASGSWSRAGSAPTRRRGTAMAYDEQRGRVVLFGGTDDTGTLGDTWEWDGKQWTRIAP